MAKSILNQTRDTSQSKSILSNTKVTPVETSDYSTVDKAVEKVTPTLTQKIGNVLKSFVSSVSPIGLNIPTISIPKTKEEPVLKGEIITGPKIEDLDTQEKELTALKSKVNLSDQKSIDDYNTKVSKLQSDISSYNKALAAQKAVGYSEYRPKDSAPVYEIQPKTFKDKYLKLSERLGELGAQMDVGLVRVTGQTVGALSTIGEELVTKPLGKAINKAFDESIIETENTKNLGDVISNISEKMDKYTGVEEKKFIDKVFEGLGSSIPFLAGGIAGKMAGVSSKLLTLGLSGTEALVNAYDDYENLIKKDDKDSKLKAVGSFAGNLVLNYFTNKLGFLSDSLNKNTLDTVKKFFIDGVVETGQETAQQLISNITQSEDPFKGLTETFLVSAPISFLFGFGGIMQNKEQAKNDEKIVAVVEKMAESGMTKYQLVDTLSKINNLNKDEVTSTIDSILESNKSLKNTFDNNQKKDIERISKEISQPTQKTTSEFKPIIDEISSQFKTKTPSIKGVNKDQSTKLSMEEAQPLADRAVDQYWKDKIQPKIEKGEATVIGADDMKDHFGEDYNDNNHPIYSRAAFQTYEKALKENKNSNVIFTGGGPSSGKTELLVKTISPNFSGVIYDSNMANYDGFKKQVLMAKEAKKNIEVYGIIPNLDKSRTFSIQRENRIGRGISDITYARGHAGFPNVVIKALKEGIIKPEEVNILDTRDIETFEEAFEKVFTGDFSKDPLALLESLEYNEETLKDLYAKKHYNKETGEAIKTLEERTGELRVRSESSKTPLQDRADKKDAIRTGDEGVLEQTKDQKDRITLPEVPIDIKRVMDYKTRLRLRGADPVLVDAIITPTGQRAYGVSVGGTLTFEKLVQQFTEDHEIFHQVWQNFDKMRLFDGFYKKGLLNEARTLYGKDLTETELEEFLASDFQQYVSEREANKPTTFFDKIKEFFDRLYAALKRIFRTQRDINEFYRTVYEGRAKEDTVISETAPESFLKQQKEGVVDFGNIEFGGQKFNLKPSTKLTSADIIKKHANIQLKRDIVITDVYGEKATLKAGEGITPYEVTGNKFILQDGEAYLVSKSQAQNVINNSKTGEAKPFAPELKQTEETVKGEVLIKNTKEYNELNKEYNELNQKRWDALNSGDNSLVAKFDEKLRVLDSQMKRMESTPTKYSQYTLPGGKNYKEILIKAPTDKEISRDILLDKISQEKYGKDYADISAKEQTVIEKLETEQYKPSTFKSSHWDEPNVISHIRMNERTYDGKKVAFMEELQSDWAREARKDSELTNEEKQRLADYKKRGYGSLNNEELADLNRLNRNEVPTHPLLKNWQELSIKRALQEAVNSNVKYFAWINGPQTAARYNLSKEVDNIKWISSDINRVKNIGILPKGGSLIAINVDENGTIISTDKGDWTGKKIDEVIGKGIAEKIMASPRGKLEGEGLNMGGEWATNLYDRQVKTIVENLTGQKVEMLDMGLPVDKNQQFFKIKVDGISRDLKNLAFISSGDEVTIGRIGEGVDEYIVTDILGNGKFKAVKQEQWELLDAEVFLNEKDAKKLNELWNKNQSTLTQTEKSERDELFKKSDENKSKFNIVRIPNDLEIETFDISKKKNVGQMAIELTPEVKAIIKGEAPQVKVSGKMPLDEVIAPPMFNIKPESKLEKKFPKFDTGNKLEDAKAVLQHVEKKLGVSSVVNDLREKEAMIEVAKESLDLSPMKELEPYVADSGAYKGTLPEVTGKPIAELKKNKDFKGVKNEKALEFAKKGDSIAQEISSEYGLEMDSNDVRAEFEDYQNQKKVIDNRAKELKQEIAKFGKTETFELIGKDKTLIGEITDTKGIPENIKEIIDQVRIEKKARREEVLNHRARPLMKYVDKKSQKLPKIGSNTAFGKEGEQILKDLKFDDIKEANQALEDYISKRNEFLSPISRLRLDERNAKFLRDKQQIMEEVEKKIRAEGRDRKQKIEAIRDFFYMTEGEMKDVIGAVDYRLLSDKEFDALIEKIREESLKIAEHMVAMSEVEWTIAQKELHRVENLQQVMGFPVDINKMTTEQLDLLNKTLGTFEKGDVFLGVREIETLAKNANLPDVKTQRQILEEVLGKRTGLPIEKLREIVVGSFDDLRSAISLARQNAFYEVLVSDFYQLKIEAGMRYREIEQKTNELVKKARESRKQNWKQRIAPTDDMVIAYLEEGDLAVKEMIAKDMSPQELELAHYVKEKYAEMRDFLIARQQLEKERQNYYTHRPRGFFEAWLRDGVTKTPIQFIRAFGKAFKETFIDVNKMDEATFKILNEQTSEILPLEKFFKYSMRRSGQLIPTKNLANAFLGYVKTFELKRGLDQYMPRMEAVARALTPTETTEGGIVKDTSLEKFVKKWINTQKGRPVTIGPIQPGGVLDGLIRSGIAFTRFLDLALRLPAQIMSIVGEESATWINIGTKKYLLGEYRAKTAQGKKIAKKYEAFVGTTFWDKMKEESMGVASKLGETLFAFYGIAARQSNIHHLLGVLTKEEFNSGNISPERLVQIKMEMNRWRADDLLYSVMGKTSVGAMFREHKSWAIPIANQTLSNIKTLSKMVSNKEYKTAAKSKEFSELFRGTMLTLILVITLSRIYNDLKEKKDRNLIEELEYRAMNDAQSFLAALSPKTLGSSPRLVGWLTDLTTALTSFIGAMVANERTATGQIPGAKMLVQSFTPKLIKPLLTPSDDDKIMTSVTTSTIAAQKKLDEINEDIVSPAKTAWEAVKNIGVGTEEADAIVSELSDDKYEAYKLVKKSDVDYWTELVKKVTPIVQQAFKLEFGTPEADKLVENLSDDEYTSYQLVKKNLYGVGDDTATPGDWDQQSFFTHVENIARGWTADFPTAFENLITAGDWKITAITNGQIIVERMPLSASQEEKRKVAKDNENYKLDHIVPIKGGGNNAKKNLNIITTEQWEENTHVELYLIKQLKAGNITGKELREFSIRYKAGKNQIPPENTKLINEYNKKYGGQPITFDEIKQEVLE